jgi:small subunit ribosomal protein S15
VKGNIMISAFSKMGLRALHARSPSDTASPEVQTALSSARLVDLSAHMSRHPNDKHALRGLVALASQRKRSMARLRMIELKRQRALARTPAAPESF